MFVTGATRIAQRTTETGATPSQAGEWLPFAVPGWALELLAVVAVVVGTWALSRLLVGLLGRRIARRLRRPSLSRMFIHGLRVGVAVFGLLVILRIFGLRLGDIALSVTVFTAVLGVILAPIVGSVISGVFLLADQPYEIGDMVELADTNQRGFVEDITLRYTKIFTLDNTFLVIPNGTIRERDVVNYSAEDPRTRRSIGVVVTYESDVERARTLIERAAREIEGVIDGGPNIRVGAARYPAGPTCYIDEFGDHGVALTLRYWIEEPYKLLATRSRIQTAIREAFDGENVEIAYPHSHLLFDDTSGELRVRDAGPESPPADRPTDVRGGPDPSSG